MGAFDRFFSKEQLIRKTIEIDNKLYEKLRELSDTKYDASVSKLINASIEELVKTENIRVYEKGDNEITLKHSFYNLGYYNKVYHNLQKVFSNQLEEYL